jgi:serine/threonine protein kinase
MARFPRQAEVLASLKHPNTSQIYGIEDRALVDRFLFETALIHARQIADAVETAHEKNINHRDLSTASHS